MGSKDGIGWRIGISINPRPTQSQNRSPNVLRYEYEYYSFMEPDIIFENENLLVLDKPAGLVVHSDGRTDEETLADWVLENRPEMESVGESWRADSGEIIPRPGIVHRLDRATSGVMVLAKDQATFEYLKSLFQNRKIQKTYRAFVSGSFKEKEGVIDAAIGKSRKDFRKWSAEEGARGKLREAFTEFSVLGEYFDEQADEVASFLELRPKTGRTHQLRVHLKSLGRPIIGDELYAPKKLALLGFDRLALHAFSLEFQDQEEATRVFEAGLPEDFENALKHA